MSMIVEFFLVSFDPLLVTINPRNFPEVTPKVRFFGMSFMEYFRRTVNADSRAATCSFSVTLFTSMSSTYASTVFPRTGAKILFASL
ncbi:hypothetical protein Dimus_038241 [Dionaea muscipula]